MGTECAKFKLHSSKFVLTHTVSANSLSGIQPRTAGASNDTSQ